jgi:hypothetical protein
VPYLALFTLATIFFSVDVPFFSMIMESVFNNNALILIGVLFIYCIAVVNLSCIYFFVSINKSRDALAVAKTGMIIKLVQIPAYVLIFILSVFFIFNIFTMPFTFGLFVIDCLSVFTTDLLIFSSVLISIKNEDIVFKDVTLLVFLQFVFCLDVIASVILYRKLKAIENKKMILDTVSPLDAERV